jgi:transcriptional regulator GlxA family with amidase domain
LKGPGCPTRKLAPPVRIVISRFASTGTPRHQWPLRQRVDRAKTLLRDGEVSLADVAFSSCFAEKIHLPTIFSLFYQDFQFVTHCVTN